MANSSPSDERKKATSAKDRRLLTALVLLERGNNLLFRVMLLRHVDSSWLSLQRASTAKLLQFRLMQILGFASPGIGFHNAHLDAKRHTHLDAKRQKPLIFQRLIWTLWTVLEVFESNLGRHDWIRTSDLFRVKEAL
jgi:hypothetical protein